MRYAIGIDVGGTFTDFLRLDGTGAGRIFKLLSTPDDPSDAVIAGLAEMAAADGLALADFLGAVDRIVHGTTVTTNAVLTGTTARTGLLTTRGFRDALQMRRGIREKLYDNKYPAPTPIVPRRLRLPVTERIDETGGVLEPLELGDVDAAIDAFTASGVEAVAVCFMHAYANPDHEVAALDRLRARMPDAYVSVSSSILPQVRFYERTSTTVLNVAVGPILKRYLDRLTARLADAGFAGTLLIIQSNGGVTAPGVATELAASTLLSGPAAGPIAGRALAARQGRDSFITIDMGGTSFEASLVRGGAPAITTAATVNRFAMALPAADIKTIGAGGGSIAWIDGGGLLRMGPQSAGAKPGPACYGLGGDEPTCSDAGLVLGLLSADYFAGGRIKLDARRAETVIRTRVAEPMGMGVVEAAAGMYRVMNVNMASAIREISVERGFDPRDFPLICAGGAGALHAAMIARELGIGEIVVPREASIFCASGMMQTDLRHDHVRSCAATLTADALDRARFAGLWGEMAAEGRRTLAAEGVPADRQRFAHALDLRYTGQYHEVRVEDVPQDLIDGFALDAIADLFHTAHDRLYGYALKEEGTGVELVNLRLTAFGQTDKPRAEPEPLEGPDPASAHKGRRPVFLPERGEHAEIDVYDGDRLRPGDRLDGPAIVETVVTTIFVPTGFALSVDPYRDCILTDGAAS